MDNPLFTSGPEAALGQEEGTPELSRRDLLAIFDPDSVRAEERYAELYYSLLRYFEYYRNCEPQDMAQETLKRGFARLQEGQKITTDNPAGYFFGIARNLVREGWTARPEEPLEEQDLPIGTSLFHDLNSREQEILLQQCLRNLLPEELEMLMAHVEGKGPEWSRKSGLRPSVLRLRVYRIRRRLEELVSIRAATSPPKKS
jgi:hypothetical protein